MAKKEKQPNHDALFKHFLTQPETGKEFLSLYLPSEIQSLCDLTTLKLEPGSFVDRHFCFNLRESLFFIIRKFKNWHIIFLFFVLKK